VQGLGLDVSGAGELQASLQALRSAHDAAYLDVVQLMATKPMQARLLLQCPVSSSRAREYCF